MTPLEFMARLAALIPPPRHPLVRYFGVLAPASKWRRLVVPSLEARTCHDGEVPAKSCKTKGEGDELTQAARTASRGNRSDDGEPTRRSPYIDWATLMRRGLGIDVLDCPRCHGRMRPIAVIEREEAVEKIMAHLSLPLKPEELADGTVVYDVTGDGVLASPVWWGDDEAGCGTGPPGEWDGVDPPSPGA